jgi:hypothetical protein
MEREGKERKWVDLEFKNLLTHDAIVNSLSSN